MKTNRTENRANVLNYPNWQCITKRALREICSCYFTFTNGWQWCANRVWFVANEKTTNFLARNTLVSRINCVDMESIPTWLTTTSPRTDNTISVRDNTQCIFAELQEHILLFAHIFLIKNVFRLFFFFLFSLLSIFSFYTPQFIHTLQSGVCCLYCCFQQQTYFSTGPI